MTDIHPCTYTNTRVIMPWCCTRVCATSLWHKIVSVSGLALASIGPIQRIHIFWRPFCSWPAILKMSVCALDTGAVQRLHSQSWNPLGKVHCQYNFKPLRLGRNPRGSLLSAGGALSHQFGRASLKEVLSSLKLSTRALSIIFSPKFA